VHDLAVAGSGSSFLSTVRVGAWAGLATSTRPTIMSVAAKRPKVATTVLQLLLCGWAFFMCAVRARLALLACPTSSCWRS
jgi:hypothetical protein